MYKIIIHFEILLFNLLYNIILFSFLFFIYCTLFIYLSYCLFYSWRGDNKQEWQNDTFYMVYWQSNNKEVPVYNINL